MPSSFLSAATLALSSRIRSPTSIILLELWCHLSSSTGSSMSGDHQSKIDQCELLATLCALMSFPDLLQGPEILFWTDNIGTLKACVDGYTKIPKWWLLRTRSTCASLAWALGFILLSSPGSLIAYLPSRVPFVAHGSIVKLDSARITQEASETITALNLVFRELQLPSIQNLQDRRNFI